MSSSNWLVTGVAGFIGSNFTLHLLQSGHSVYGLDDFSTGKRENLMKLLEFPAFTFIKHDLGEVETDVFDLFPEVSFDHVVHLAAQVSVVKSIDDPCHTFELNSRAFYYFLNSCRFRSIKSFVYASSCAVYGDNNNLPLREDSQLMPASPYASTKLANEAYAHSFSFLNSSINVVGLRFFNVFGPWQDYTNGYAAVIPKWISLLLNGKQPVLYGDGSATRDFVYIDNISDALIKASCHLNHSPGQILNVSSGAKVTLDELFCLICEVLQTNGFNLKYDRPIYKPWRAGEIEHSYGSTDLASALIGYNPSVSLLEGLHKLVKFEYLTESIL